MILAGPRRRFAAWRFRRHVRGLLLDAMWYDGVYPRRLARRVGRSERWVANRLAGNTEMHMADLAVLSHALGRRITVTVAGALRGRRR